MRTMKKTDEGKMPFCGAAVFVLAAGLALAAQASDGRLTSGGGGMPADLLGGTALDFEKTTVRAMAVKEGTPDKAEIRLSPGTWIDGTFFLSEAQPAVMTLVIKGKPKHKEEFRAIHGEDVRLRSRGDFQMRLELEIPAGVELSDLADGRVLSTRPVPGGVHYDIAMIADYNWTFTMQYGESEDFNWWRCMGFLLRTPLKAGAVPGEAKAWMSWKGERFTNVETFGFAVAPPIPAIGRKLSKFYLGCSTGGIYLNFSERGWEDWCRFMTSIGLNAMQPDLRVKSRRAWQLAALRRSGVEFVTPVPSGCPIYNGFEIGQSRGRPENERFQSCPEAMKGAGEWERREIASGVCPSAVYGRMPFFMTNTVPAMAREFAGYDGIWCNWEPFMYAGRGCFCARCRANFAAFVGRDEASLAADWPKCVLRGGPLYGTFSKFMSGEHAKLMRTVAEEVRKVCGGDACKAGFIPGVAWCEMASNWRSSDYASTVRPFDYARGFDWISPWGPYAIYPTQEPYAYSKWRNLRTFVAAKDVRGQVDRDYPADVRPKIMAYPHGQQARAWVCYPEALEMNIDAFFFNRWEAVSVYHFPRGYDQRWLAAFARSAEKAARYEGYVFGGRRIDGEFALEPTAPYAAPNSREGTATRGLDIKKPMLQHVAYEKDGRAILAVFNFWEKAPAFFRVRRGGRDLGELYCGALRTKVWEFAPDGAVRDFTDADVARWRAALMPALERAKAADVEYEAEFGDREYDIQDVASGSLKGRADRRAQTFTFASGDRSLVFDCRGMAVRSWKNGGRELLAGGLGDVVFERPAFDMRRARYRITNVRSGGGYVAVTASCLLSAKECESLAFLEVRQTAYVYEGLKKVVFTTTLLNRSTDEEPRVFEVEAKLADGGLKAFKSTAGGARELHIGASAKFSTTALAE